MSLAVRNSVDIHFFSYHSTDLSFQLGHIFCNFKSAQRRMEFCYEERKCGSQNICAGSMAESDDDETLSFCEMLLCDSAGTAAELASTQGDSNPVSSDHQDFHFDLDFAGSISNACQTPAADDLIFNGSLLPLSQCKARLSNNDFKSFRQNKLLLNEKLQAWRSDSLESKPSYWTSSISSNSQASTTSFNYSASRKGLKAANSSAVNNKSNVMANWTSFSSGSRSKRSSTWLQYFSLGVNRAPEMKLEDLRLRQSKLSQNGADKPFLKRTVSSYYEEGPILKKKAANFQQRSKSVKENKRAVAVETRRTKGFRILDLFTLSNSCKSITSVINCTRNRNCVESEVLAPSPKVAS